MTNAEGSDEAIVRSHLRDLESDEDNWRGYVSTEQELEELERSLLGIGVSFKVTNSRQVAEEKLGEPAKLKLMFSINRGAVPLNLAMPFRVLSLTDKGCLMGKDRHAKERMQPSPPAENAAELLLGDWTSETFKKRRSKVNGTKKKGCVATMHIKKVQVFPDYAINVQGGSKNKVVTAKSTALKKLATQLASDQPPKSEARLYVTMSKMSAHTGHDFDHFAKRQQTLDQNLINRIGELVREGITSVEEVKTCLKFYVRDVLFAGKEPPDASCRAFYPTSKDIINHIQRGVKRKHCRNVDQENVAQFVTVLQIEDGISEVILEPYCQPDEASGGFSSADEHVNVENMLPKTAREASKKSQRQITDAVRRITSVVAHCMDEDKMREAHKHMQQAYRILKSGCSPTKGTARRLRLKALQRTRGHAGSWKTRKRVGDRASEMQATANVSL